MLRPRPTLRDRAVRRRPPERLARRAALDEERANEPLARAVEEEAAKLALLDRAAEEARAGVLAATAVTRALSR